MRDRPPEVNTGTLLAFFFFCITFIISVPRPRLSTGPLQTWNTWFLRRLWRTGLSAARRTDLGTIFVSQKRLHEVVRGPHACLFCRLHLPTSSCSNLWRNTISDRGGGLISAERNKPRGEKLWGGKSSTLLSSPLPSPRAVGERSHAFLNGKKETQIREITFALRGSTAIFFNSSKIWPIMSWSPARLQPRGPSCPLQLSRCLPVMETVNILHAFTYLEIKHKLASTVRVLMTGQPAELHRNLLADSELLHNLCF